MFHDVATHWCFQVNTLQVRLHLCRIHKIAFASTQTEVIRIVALTLFLQAVVTVTTKLTCMNVSVFLTEITDRASKEGNHLR